MQLASLLTGSTNAPLLGFFSLSLRNKQKYEIHFYNPNQYKLLLSVYSTNNVHKDVNCSGITSVYFFILKCISQMVLVFFFFFISQVGTFVSRQVKRVHRVSGQKTFFFEKQIENLTTPHKTVKMCSVLFTLKAGVYGQQSRLEQTSLCEILDLKGAWLCQFSSEECGTANLQAVPFPCI